MRPIIYAATATDVANGFTVAFPLDFNRVAGSYSIQYLTYAGQGTVLLSTGLYSGPPLAAGATSTAPTSSITAGTGAAGAGTVQQTYDDVFAANALAQAIGSGTPNIIWTSVTLTSGRAIVSPPVKAFRILSPTLGDVITIIAQGSSVGG